MASYTGELQGTRTSSSGTLAANQKPDIDSVLRVLKPYNTPIFQFLFFSNKKSKPVTSESGKFSWFEDEFVPHNLAIGSAITGGSTMTVTATEVVHFKALKAYDIVLIEDTDEMAYVSAITTGTNATLTPIAGSGNLTTVSTGNIKIIGSGFPEGSAKATAVSTQEIEVYNYCNIYKELVSSTGRNQAGQKYSNGMTHAEQVQKKMEEMKFSFERNFTLSKSAGSVSGRTYGQGAYGRVSSHVGTYSTEITEDQWDDYLEDVFAKGSMTRKHACGSTQHANIQKIVKLRLGIMPAQVTTSYGVNLLKYVYGGFDVELILDKVFDGKFVNHGFTFDEENLIPRHMANDDTGSRKFRLEADVQTPGTDAKDTLLLADLGLQITNEETHAWLKKV